MRLVALGTPAALGVSLCSLLAWTPVFGLQPSGSGANQTCTEARATEIFGAQGCTRCHSVTDQTGDRTEVPAARTPPSAGAIRRGSKPMQAQRLTKLLANRFDGRGMRHPMPWKGTDSELACLVAWIADDLETDTEPSQSPVEEDLDP